MYFSEVPINYGGVLLAALVYFIIGCIWYAPFAFGKKRGRGDETVETSPQEAHTHKIGAYIGELIVSLIIAYFLALFIAVSEAEEIAEGIAVALWIWIGFIATTHFSAVLWARKTLEHFFIHAGFMLVGFIAMSIVIMSIIGY